MLKPALNAMITAPIELSMSYKDTMAGAYEEIENNSVSVKKALHHAVEQLNKQWTDNLYYWKVDKIIKAKRQIVAGTFYDIHFELYKSDCVKNNELLLDCINTAVKPVSDVSAPPCNVVVFNYLPTDGHGVDDYKITNSTCVVSEDC